MENLAHTLLGLSFAKGGLERATPLATTALVISSNLPDIDVLWRLEGGTASYLDHHRGFTHGFVGLAVLAAALTLGLMFMDRRFRLRRDPFRRPLRPVRIFLLAYLGGLGHTFMDFTNVYGVRPLLPFSSRWFYGDLAFVVDPWIWLILGSAVVWLTTTDAARTFFWIVDRNHSRSGDGSRAYASIRPEHRDRSNHRSSYLVLWTGHHRRGHAVSVGPLRRTARQVFARCACSVLRRHVDGPSVGDEGGPEFVEG